MIETIKKESRHYAKRQMTWFRKNKETIWLDSSLGVEDNIKTILKEINWKITEIQSPNPPFSAVQQVSVRFMSTHPKSYKALRNHPEYVAAIKQMELSVFPDGKS